MANLSDVYETIIKTLDGAGYINVYFGDIPNQTNNEEFFEFVVTDEDPSQSLDTNLNVGVEFRHYIQQIDTNVNFDYLKAQDISQKSNDKNLYKLFIIPSSRVALPGGAEVAITGKSQALTTVFDTPYHIITTTARVLFCG